MRKLIMKMSQSADGFVGTENEDGSWMFKSSTEDSRAWALQPSLDAGLIIMGRKSFEMWAPYWPTANGPFAAPMNEVPKAVFTQKGFTINPPKPGASAAETSWYSAQVFNGNLAENIRQLKQQPGKHILAIGGAGFMRSLIAANLIDEYYLPTHPVALGAGLQIFSGLEKPMHLKLVSSKTFSGGIVGNIYQPA
ncbi:MAG TPA: dihydrofolate reductase family protein [Chitinophagaceae bacterium]|nr:dihydrofolate reductase family protein [Chitinophagaceae bacterium]